MNRSRHGFDRTPVSNTCGKFCVKCKDLFSRIRMICFKESRQKLLSLGTINVSLSRLPSTETLLKPILFRGPNTKIFQSNYFRTGLIILHVTKGRWKLIEFTVDISTHHYHYNSIIKSPWVFRLKPENCNLWRFKVSRLSNRSNSRPRKTSVDKKKKKVITKTERRFPVWHQQLMTITRT